MNKIIVVKMDINKLFSVRNFEFGIAVICLFFAEPEMQAQLPNGSVADAEYIAFVEANLVAENQLFLDTSNPDLNVNLSMEIFVVNSIDGQSHFDSEALTYSIPTVNSYFRNLGIQFRLGDIHEVKEYPDAHITHKDSTQEMEAKYAISRTINLFVVDSILLDGVMYFGYSHFPDDTLRNSMFIRKDQVMGNTLSALLGSFFGLMRTHETAGGAEFENGNLCESRGDYICDTYGDGGLYELVDSSCIYRGAQPDPGGVVYAPSVANVMSDSPDMCRCVFTQQQYRRMKYYYLTQRKYLR